MPIPDELDKGYYIKMAWDRLNDFGIKQVGGGDLTNATKGLDRIDIWEIEGDKTG